MAQKFQAGGAPAGLAALRYGRRELRDQLTDIGFDRGGARAFTRQYLPTPSDLFTRYGDNHREPASSTTNFNFTGDLVVRDQRDAARMAAERRRLQQSSHGQIPVQAAS